MYISRELKFITATMVAAILLASTAVVAQPDPKWGETPCAFIELKEGASATAEEIIEFCRARMARFKAPKSVVFEKEDGGWAGSAPVYGNARLWTLSDEDMQRLARRALGGL